MKGWTVFTLMAALVCFSTPLDAAKHKKKGKAKVSTTKKKDAKEPKPMEEYPGTPATKDAQPMETYPDAKGPTGKEKEAKAAQQEGSQDAKALFEKGVAAFSAGKYKDALAYFHQSYGINPKPKVLFNIAMCYRALAQFKESVETFKQYLGQGGKTLPKKKIKEVNELIMEMESSLAQVTVIVNENGATILVDAQEAGIAPLQDILVVNPGTHDIEATKEGFFTAKQTIEIAGGKNEVVSLTLVPKIAAQQETPSAADDEAGKAKKKKMKTILLWSLVSVAVAGAGATTGVLIWRFAPGGGGGPAADWTVHGR
jgi:tetratricopeptide (TPR) repeat protein